MPPADLTLRLADGTPIRLRPPRPADAGVLGRLVEALSPDDRRRRFHGAVRALSAATLDRMVAPAPATTLALVAEDPHGGLVADVRAVLDATGRDAEFGLMVATAWQGRGLGRLALRALCAAAAARGWGWLYGHVLADNVPMLGLVARCGFRASPRRGDPGVVVVEARLEQAMPLAA